MIQHVLQALQSSEMTAAQVYEKNFYKVISPEKVFVVDVKKNGVIFGWAFQGKGEAGEYELNQLGIVSNDCNLRFFHEVSSEQEWYEAKNAIRKCYHDYLDWSKDALLAHIKELRKAFIQRFTVRLKPLGFRKNSNHWKRTIHEQFSFEVNAQKSSYSDEYYVNLYIAPSEGIAYPDCFSTRVMLGSDYLCDWQLTPAEEIERGLDRMMDEIVRPVLELELVELGRQAFIQLNCHCRHKRCKSCWVEKNYWEHCGIPEP